jgi:hypothetical protein
MITAFNRSELQVRAAKRQFDRREIISLDAAQFILPALRSGSGKACTRAFNHIELAFYRGLRQGTIDPHELFTNLRNLVKRAGDEVVREFDKRFLPLLPKDTQNLCCSKGRRAD